MKIETDKNIIDKQLIDLSQLSKEQILEKYNVDLEGLNQIEADEKLEEEGRNIIDIQTEKGMLRKLEEAVINPFNVVLIIIVFVNIITDIVLTDEPSYATVILILITVFISAFISFREQEKSNRAARKLQKMISNKIDVIRNGNDQVIEIEEVVTGDIVRLSSGDMIPGDVRFLETKDLFIDQAALTGESNPVEKFANKTGGEDITSLSNMGFMGTNVVSGTAIAIVLNTGNRTYFGAMAKSITTHNVKSSFEKGVDSVSSLLIRFMLVMVPVIFFANLVTKGSFIDSLLFAITIAVGLTPEMLPVIMTSTLAKGAVEMSKKETIVKRLGAIQTFGEMDVLCTDKTGTLTEDEIILEKYMDAEGREDKRILRHAFLNSYYQTGLKNLIDEAIISRAEKEELGNLKFRYIREDEIPFDFTRRRMSVVLKDDDGKRQLITKGAVDEVMNICSFVELNGEAIPLTEVLVKNAMRVYEENNVEGLRVLAVAQKNEIHGIGTFGVDDEKDMVLIGFVGFLDPPKISAKSAIETLKKHGVRVVVLTGDSEGVAINVCKKLGIETDNCLTGKDVEKLNDEQLKNVCEKTRLFAKLSPFQKQRVVKAFQDNGHTVGYMGDGINDGPPLKQSDVGISVDSAVDIAKETADIILLDKDLNVLEEGVIGGRKTFANISKYIKMATSGNFGNMFSVMIASIFLPFLPMLPIHILIQNLLCDFGQLGMPFDNVDKDYIEKPRKWETSSIKKFMFCFGVMSSIFDIICFAILWYVLKYNTIEYAEFFQTGWFMFGIISQTLIIHMIRTSKIPFIQSKPSIKLVISTLAVTIITLTIGFTKIAGIFDLAVLNSEFMFWLGLLVAGYAIVVQLVKRIYIHYSGQWI